MITPQSIDYRNIPVQADVIAGIIRLDPESTSCFRDLDRYLQSDQGVAALVLRVVNSPLYSRGRKIATIPTAITVLGFNVVRSLAMLAFSRSMFSRTRDPLFRQHIWQHSLLTAIAGRTVCKDLGEAGIRDEMFVAGLMHDMGNVLLFTHDPGGYARVFERVLEGGESFRAAERAVAGCDHCEVGREAARQWNLPERFADYMGCDLAPAPPGAAADPAMHALAVANALIHGFAFGHAGQQADEHLARLRGFGVDAELCARWLAPEMLDALTADDTYQLCASL